MERFMIYGKSGVSLTGEWIREHLREVGEDYAYSMWRKFRTFLDIVPKARKPSYNSFARYVNLLKNIGLVILSRYEPSKPRPRSYYKLNYAMVDSPAWLHPYQHLYPITNTKYRVKHGLPVRWKALKRPVRPRGRPRKTQR